MSEINTPENFDAYYAFVMKTPLGYIQNLEQQKYMIDTKNYAWFWQKYRDNGAAEKRFLAFQLQNPGKEYPAWEKDFAHQEFADFLTKSKPLFFKESQRIFIFSPEERSNIETAYDTYDFSQVKNLLYSYTKEHLEHASDLQKSQFFPTKRTLLPLYDTMVEKMLKPHQNHKLFDTLTQLYSPLALVGYTDSCTDISYTNEYTQIECKYRVQHIPLSTDTHIQEVYAFETQKDEKMVFRFFPVSETDFSPF